MEAVRCSDEDALLRQRGSVVSKEPAMRWRTITVRRVCKVNNAVEQQKSGAIELMERIKGKHAVCATFGMSRK